MSCLIYRLDLNIRKRIFVDNINSHTEMNRWLKQNGDNNYIYEIWKGNKIHSRWIFKPHLRWGRCSTPSG